MAPNEVTTCVAYENSVPQPEPTILLAMGRLEALVTAHNETAQELSKSLAPVLRQRDVPCGAVENKAPAVGSEHGQALDLLCDRLEAATDVVRNVIVAFDM